jgi:hypothetical protein
MVNGFQQAWAERCVHAESGVNDLRGNGILGHSHFFIFSPRRKDAKSDPATSGPVDSTGRQDG